MKECFGCRKNFSSGDYRQKFCTKSCSATFNNLSREAKFGLCPVCGTKRPKRNMNYCSIVCRQIFSLLQWLSGEPPVYKFGGVPDTIRQFLLNESDHKCSQCGWNELNPVTGRCPLEVDHIDGNSANNLRDNLRILCPNCHSLTSTYKHLNPTGSGRLRKK